MNKLLKSFLVAILLIYIFLILKTNITIFHSDPINGFLALKGLILSGKFNFIPSYSISNFIHPNFSFLTWWSPGQYLIPFIISWITGMTFIMGVKFTIIMSILSMSLGMYFLFDYLNFDKKITILSIILVILQRGIIINIWGYDGGDILLTSFFPWLILAFLKYSKGSMNIKSSIFIFLIVIIAIVLKLTAIVILCSLLIFPILKEFKGNFDLLFIKRVLKYSPAFIIVIIAFILTYFTFLSRGTTPNSLSDFIFNYHDTIGVFEMPLSILNLDYISIYLKNHSPILYLFSNLIFIYLSYLIIINLYKSKNEEYRLLCFSFILFFGFYFLYSFNFGTVSGHARHLRFVSLLILPFILDKFIIKGSFFTKWSFVLLFSISTFYGVYSVYKYKSITIANPVIGLKGFDFHTVTGTIPQNLVDNVHILDVENESIFFTSNLHICLDLPGNNYGFLDDAFYTDLEKYHNKSKKKIYIICDNLEFTRLNKITNSNLSFQLIAKFDSFRILSIESI